MFVSLLQCAAHVENSTKYPSSPGPSRVLKFDHGWRKAIIRFSPLSCNCSQCLWRHCTAHLPRNRCDSRKLKGQGCCFWRRGWGLKWSLSSPEEPLSLVKTPWTNSWLFWRLNAALMPRTMRGSSRDIIRCWMPTQPWTTILPHSQLFKEQLLIGQRKIFSQNLLFSPGTEH